MYAQRYVTGENTYKNAVFLTLQLKDLSNIGKVPKGATDIAVPGYIPNLDLSGKRKTQP